MRRCWTSGLDGWKRVLCGGTIDEDMFSRSQAESIAEVTHHDVDRMTGRMKVDLVLAEGLWQSFMKKE